MEDNHNRQDMDEKNCKGRKSGETAGLSAKLRAFIAGLTPNIIFRFTLISSVIVALAATIIYRTASESLHVNIDKVDTASISLSGSQDLGGIEPGGYVPVEWGVTNHSKNRLMCSFVFR